MIKCKMNSVEMNKFVEFDLNFTDNDQIKCGWTGTNLDTSIRQNSDFVSFFKSKP